MKMKITVKLLSIIGVLIALTGCIPALIATVGATAGGAIIYDKRSTEVMLNDVDTTNKALAILNSDPELRGRARIDVSTFNHIVLLVGQAQTEEIKRRAYEDVSDVSNVKRIYNQIEIRENLTFRDQSEDSWITSKVKTAMLTTKGLSSSQIKVITENKVVYLMGMVSPNQAELATQAARQIGGVRKVVQVFEYEK